MYRIRQIAPGVQATAGAASALTAIPNDSAGIPAKAVMISVITASEMAIVRPVEDASGAVTSANGMPVIDSTPRLLVVAGYQFIAHIRGRSNNCVFNITPVENY